MSEHLARSSQHSSQGRIRRLSFRPMTEEQEVQDQATSKIPASTPDSTRSRAEFLAAPKLSLQEHMQQDCPSPLQESREKTSKPGQFKQFQHTKTAQPPGLKPGQAIPPYKMLTVRSGKVEEAQTVITSAILRPDVALQDTIKLTQLNTITPLLPDPAPGEPGLDDDPEFAKYQTLPMMVLTGIAQKQGKPQSEMKSEVSGAAGAAGLVGLGNIIGSILKYVVNFLIQYGFGAAGYGLYTLSLSLVNLVSAIFNLGLDDAMVRYVAIYRGKQQIKSLRGLLIFCTVLAGIAGIIGALLLFIFTPPLVALWINLKHHSELNKDMLGRAVALLQVMAPVIPLMTMQVMWFAGLRGFKAFKWRVLSSSILQPTLQILLMLIVLRFFHNKDGITAVAVVLFVSTMFNTILNMYFLFRQVERVVTPEPEKYEVREWLTFATLNFLTTIIDTVLDSIDTILLAAFGVANVALGQYGAAMRLSNFIAMPLLSINNVFAPTIAELHSKGEMEKLETMFKVVTKWTITFSLPIFLIIVLFAPYLLALPGASFIPAWPLLIAFAFGGLINAGTGAVGYMLLMTGYQRLSFLNSLVAVIVNIGLGILLTPRYGAMGTAISTGLAICALNLMRLLQVRALLKIHPYRRDVFKPIIAGLISSALVGAVLYLLYISHVRTSFHLQHAILSAQLLLVPVLLASYIGLIILFKGSPEDEIVLKALRKKFLRGGRGGKINRKSK